ncbi:MAG: hypothetical protein LBD90_04650 [Bifidobacteriaceae bacterium]|jgi:hypothetical protein|nr:hypothetical protein [Bifidobacteriaceae bacterium]
MTVAQIVLVGHTHHDLGYTASPRLVDVAHRRMVPRVLDLVESSPGDGPEAFRWTFEVARPVLEHWRTADSAQRRRLVEACRSGRVSVTGGYLNMTQLIDDAELEESYARLEPLRRAGLEIRTEQHGDVNGIAWGTVEAMGRAGLSRLVMALNPDHGRPPFPQPTGFWWEGQSGRRVFVWLSTHYGVGEEWGLVDGDTRRALTEVEAFVARLDARTDYPYDLALIHAANDNRWPTDRFVELVGRWNARHRELPMRTATIDEALDILQAQAQTRPDVPVMRGEWADWWAHGHGSSAREVAVAREARRFWEAARATLALARLRGDGAERVALSDVIGYRRAPYRLSSDAELAGAEALVAENLLLFDEHTWGSWETYSAPSSTFSRSHWNAKAGFAHTAWDWSRAMAVEGLHRLAAPVSAASAAPDAASGPAAGVLVLNPSNTTRREVIEVEVAVHRRERLAVEVGPWATTLARAPRPADRRPGRRVEQGGWIALVEPGAAGVTSLVETATGREWVDPAFGCALGELVREEPLGPHPMFEDPKRFRPEDPGPAFARRPAEPMGEPEVLSGAGWAAIAWASRLPGGGSARSALTLGGDWLALDVELAKPKVRSPESWHLTFPFRLAQPRFWVDGTGGVFAADSEQLPDTCRDWYSIQRAVGVSSPEGGVLWSALDAPLVQLGDFQAGRWSRRLPVRGGLITSWLANNLHFTNFQAAQEIDGRYRYRFRPGGRAPTRQDTGAFGRLVSPGLQAIATSAAPDWTGPTGLTVTPPGAVAAEPRLDRDGQVVVRLRNLTGRPERARVSFVHPERPDRASAADAVLAPHGSASVRLEI